MGDILDSGDYDAVRQLIGASATSVPNAVIESFPYLDYVEQIVKDMADGWSSDLDFDAIKLAAGNDWLYLRVGTAHLLAARLIGYVSSKKGAGFKAGGYGETGIELNWDERFRELVQEAAKAFARISTRDWTRQTIFIATGPTSSGEAVADEWEEIFEMIQPRILDFAEEDGEDDAYYSTAR